MPTSPNTKVKNLSAQRERLRSQVPPRRKSTRQHTLPANVTSEGDWDSGPPPQVKTSRMFIGMLALHLVAVGGLVAFHFYGESAPSKPIIISPSGAKVPVTATPAPALRAAPMAAAPTLTTDYIVRMDETWESIATARGLSVEELRAANPHSELNVGRRISIPTAPRVITASSTPRMAPQQTPIQPPQANPTPRYAANPEAAQAPKPTLPAVVPVKASASATTTSKPASVSKTYTVAKGETIYSIAKRRGITEKALLKLNGMADAGKLHAGQKLKLPD